MTVDELEAAFERLGDSYRKSEEILDGRRLASRPDLNAFLLLHKLLPGRLNDIVAGARHDEIYLSIDVNELASVATEDDVADLVRCGVRWDENALCMFV